VDPRIAHLSGIEFVEHYLYRTKGVFEFSFITLEVTQREHSETALEDKIREWERIAGTDSTADYAQEWIRSLQYDQDCVRAERSVYGESFLHMATAAVAGSIIMMAYQGIRMGEQRGNVAEGRMVHDPYSLRDFVKLSRDHGAHFWEDVTKAHSDRLNFQKEVLGYDQQADGTHINHSVALLHKLGWHWYKDVKADLIKLFDPTVSWNPTSG